MRGRWLGRAAADDWETLISAVNRGDPAIVRLRIQTEGRTPLMTEAVRSYTEIVRVLLASGADPLLPDAEGTTALVWAEWANKPETAALLREADFALGSAQQRGKSAN